LIELKRLLERTEQKSNFSLLGMLDLARFLEPYRLAFAEAYRLLCIGCAACHICYLPEKFLHSEADKDLS